MRRALPDQTGSTAIEFALVAMPFIGLTCAILETGIMAFNNTVIQGAVSAAAREVRTGQLQAGSGATPAQQASVLQAFQTAACANLFSQLPCSSLTYDVRSFTSFGAIALPAPVINAQGVMTNASFNTGASSATAGAASIVAVRVVYTWTPITPGLSLILGGSAGTPMTITYTVILRNEPF
jgi:Flp pilus assembly protein TadG